MVSLYQGVSFSDSCNDPRGLLLSNRLPSKITLIVCGMKAERKTAGMAKSDRFRSSEKPAAELRPNRVAVDMVV